jgi:ABC-type transport system involved in multi-copper enzyme maturation permease subunit
MRMLIWKELREQRLIPLAMGLLVVVVIVIGFFASRIMAKTGGWAVGMKFDETTMFLWLGIMLSGLFSGAGAVASEIGSGTLSFLMGLPVSRLRLWVAKAVAGVIVMCIAQAAVYVAYFLTTALLFPGDVARSGGMGGFVGRIAHDARDAWLGAFYVYAVALLVSTLVDRAVAASVATIVIASLASIAFSSIIGAFLQHAATSAIIYVASMYFIAGFLGASLVALYSTNGYRSKRPLIASLLMLLVWFAIGTAGTAVYGRIADRQWDDMNQARIHAGSINILSPGQAPQDAPESFIRPGRHWTLEMPDEPLGMTSTITIGIERDDLTISGAVPTTVLTDRAIDAQFLPLSRAHINFRSGHSRVVALLNIHYHGDQLLGWHEHTVSLLDRAGRYVGEVDVIANHTPAQGGNK